MARSARRRKRDASEDVSGQLLLSFWLLESLLPVGGGELEHAIAGPGADEAEQITDVAVGLDAVEAGASEQRDEGDVGEGAVVAAEEEPVLAADHLAPQVELAEVVVEGEPTVVEESLQVDALVARVAKRVLNRRLVEQVRKFGVTPFEEAVNDGAALVAPRALAFFAGRIRDGPFDAKKSGNVGKSGFRAVWI